MGIRDGRPIAVTGATGYIGARLVPRLLDQGWTVRCLVRSPRKLSDRPWARDSRVELVKVDLTRRESVAEALSGCRAAYYLVHAMISAGSAYAERDRDMAGLFAAGAAASHLERIIYLGGLGETGADLSDHLASRREVEQILGAGPVPLTTLRAAMIIGSGSASFEILRYLVERLPVMVTPKWVHTQCQPIAIRNVLGYLIDCLRTPETVGATLDIGGPDVLSYRDLMRLMAEERRLPPRVVIPVPVLTPTLSALWIHLVTPVGREIARPLAEGLRNRVVCRNDLAQQLMPQPLLGAREAIRTALERTEQQDVESVWSAAGVIPGDPDWAGGKAFVDRREADVEAPAAAVFQAVRRLGGANGWYAAGWLWRLRGALDRLAGGPGLSRGRRSADEIAYGEAIDFWRVADVEQDRRLELRAEMKLPGEARLAFTIEPTGRPSGCRLVQVATFRPKGLIGLLYWYAVSPLHAIVFRGMLEGIRRNAESGVRKNVEAARGVRETAVRP
jgi:uncharacterized protein YbjT (DUF2867 family)